MNETYYRNLTNEELISHQNQHGTTLLEHYLAKRLCEEMDDHAETQDDLEKEILGVVTAKIKRV